MFVERPFGSQTDFILWRYDINAGTMVEVLSGSNLVNMSFPADWGSNGWVLLNLLSAEGQNIFKLRDIGDSLQQVTFTNGNLSPVWSPSSFAFGYSVIDGSGRSVKVVTSTGLSDTLVEVPLNGSSCWFEEGRVASVGMSGVFVGGVETDEMMWICDMPQDLYDFASPAGIAVLPDHETILWMHTGGLYRTNSASGVTQQLSRTCNSQYFVGLDYSPQTNKLVTTRITRTPVSAQELRIETDIVLMNPDGTGQEVLVFPFPE